MFPNLPNGHLYQWITTCGTLLAVASIIGVAVQMNSHNKFAYETAAQLLAQEHSKQAREFWARSFQQQQSNTKFVGAFLIVSTIVGFLAAVAGSILWYRRVQWYEDQERLLGHMNREHDTDTKLNRKKLLRL